MLVIPKSINVVLVDHTGSPLQAEGVLIVVNIRCQGQPYFSHPLGLTDRRGTISATQNAITSGFRRLQGVYPMDLKVSLSDCDPTLVVEVVSANELDERRKFVATRRLTPPEIRELYARAHQSVEPVSVTVEAGNVNEVLVRIPTKRLDP